ncbi:hypothetical protein [Acidovorax sp.]|uniref:hypothetical protein n=1 Tax=Acidovorax sp. TaxID=1872122 RepID=UPI00391F9CD5
MKTSRMEPVEFSSMNGLPTIVWQRPGIEAFGEPPIVKEVRVYENDQAREVAFHREMDNIFAADGTLRGVCYCRVSTRRGAVVSIRVLKKSEPGHVSTSLIVTGADFHKVYAQVIDIVATARQLPTEGPIRKAMEASKAAFMERYRLKLTEVRFETAVEIEADPAAPAA